MVNVLLMYNSGKTEELEIIRGFEAKFPDGIEGENKQQFIDEIISMHRNGYKASFIEQDGQYESRVSIDFSQVARVRILCR